MVWIGQEKDFNMWITQQTLDAMLKQERENARLEADKVFLSEQDKISALENKCTLLKLDIKNSESAERKKALGDEAWRKLCYLEGKVDGLLHTKHADTGLEQLQRQSSSYGLGMQSASGGAFCL